MIITIVLQVIISWPQRRKIGSNNFRTKIQIHANEVTDTVLNKRYL